MQARGHAEQWAVTAEGSNAQAMREREGCQVAGISWTVLLVPVCLGRPRQIMSVLGHRLAGFAQMLKGKLAPLQPRLRTRQAHNP